LLSIQTTAALGSNNRVNETLGIRTELEITSQAADFIKQILAFIAYEYGGSSLYCEVSELKLFSHTGNG
jgi:hypothetical protein